MYQKVGGRYDGSEKKYIENDGNIGIYEFNIVNSKIIYVQYHNINNMIYGIISETNEIENINMNNTMYYCEKIIEGKDIYEVKMYKRTDMEKITIKIDLNEYKKYFIEKNPNVDESTINLLFNFSYIYRFNIEFYDSFDNIVAKATYINLSALENGVAIYEACLINEVDYSYIKLTNQGFSGQKERIYLQEGEDILNFNIPKSGYHGTMEFKRYIQNNKKNNYEFIVKITEPVRINVDYSQISTEIEDGFEWIAYLYFRCLDENNIDNDYYNGVNNKNLVEIKDNKISFEIYPVPVEYILVFDLSLFKSVDGKNYMYNFKDCVLTYENKILENIRSDWRRLYCQKILKKEEGKQEYNFQIKKVKSEISSNIKWEESNKLILQFEGSNKKGLYDCSELYSSGTMEPYMLFVEKLPDNVTISQKYENDSRWLIVNEEEISDRKLEINNYNIEYYKKFISDLEVNENIPEYIIATFFKYGNIDKYSKDLCINGDKYYIYVKDKNLLYCINAEENILENIDLVYRDKSDKFIKKRFETNAICFWRYYIYSAGYQPLRYTPIPIDNKELKYEQKEKVEIEVNKLTKEIENKISYIGLFENEKDEVTDKVYNMEIKEGVGSVTINVEDYDSNKNYYIYEVDENGRKINNNSIEYNKNKVLEKYEEVDRYEINSDREVISSVKTIGEIEDGITTLKKILDEENYVDNSMLKSRVKVDTVTIKPKEEKLYLVKYETQKGGTLEGDMEEIVEEGNTPTKVPEVKVEENYEFEKWVVIKNGEEIEVNPSKYIVLEDTTFIAKYKKIENKVEEKPNLPDTRDINIWKYVGIAVISIICIVIMILFIRVLNKKNNK